MTNKEMASLIWTASNALWSVERELKRQGLTATAAVVREAAAKVPTDIAQSLEL